MPEQGLVPTSPEAQDLTAEERQARIEHCQQLHTQIAASLRAGREALWLFAKAVYEFDQEHGWSALGYDTLNDYLADPEIAVRRSTYFQARKRYEKIVIQRGVQSNRLDSLDPSKVDLVLPAIEQGKVELNEALDDVEALGSRDLREKYFGRKEEPEPEPEPAPEPDDEEFTPPPMNDGEDVPMMASDVVVEAEGTDLPVEPDQNGALVQSGQVQDAIEWVDMALRQEASAAVRIQALRKCKELLSVISVPADATYVDAQ
jgi:hypothetical protein